MDSSGGGEKPDKIEVRGSLCNAAKSRRGPLSRARRAGASGWARRKGLDRLAGGDDGRARPVGQALTSIFRGPGSPRPDWPGRCRRKVNGVRRGRKNTGGPDRGPRARLHGGEGPRGDPVAATSPRKGPPRPKPGRGSVRVGPQRGAPSTGWRVRWTIRAARASAHAGAPMQVLGAGSGGSGGSAPRGIPGSPWNWVSGRAARASMRAGTAGPRGSPPGKSGSKPARRRPRSMAISRTSTPL